MSLLPFLFLLLMLFCCFCCYCFCIFFRDIANVKANATSRCISAKGNPWIHYYDCVFSFCRSFHLSQKLETESRNPELVHCVHIILSCHALKRPLHHGTRRMCEICLPTERKGGYWNTHSLCAVGPNCIVSIYYFGLMSYKEFFLSHKLVCISGFSAPLSVTCP